VLKLDAVPTGWLRQKEISCFAERYTMKQYLAITTAVLVTCGLLMIGCGNKTDSAKPETVVITNSGSDTMVNLAQMWSEAYRGVKPNISVEVGGGGSGVGIRDLMQGITQIANASRSMKDSEKAQAKQNTGKEPIEWIVGYDALAVYVNTNNPVEKLSFEELKAVYAEGGTTDKWSQLNVKLDGNDEIVRVSRQNSSGTYFYFREHVLDNKDFKMGSKDMSGSKDVVELVAKTPGAIGYSGMGYLIEGVKFVALSRKKGEETYLPSLENATSGNYPLARPLRMYTLGQPEGEVKAYLDWILSPAGQDIVRKSGYVPVK